MKIKDILAEKDNLLYAIEQYGLYQDGVSDRDTFIGNLNEMFDEEYRYESWIRYLGIIDNVKVLFEDDPAYTLQLQKDKMKVNIDKIQVRRMLTAVSRQEYINDMVKEALVDFTPVETRPMIGVQSDGINYIFIADLHYEKPGDFIEVWEGLTLEQYETYQLVFTGDEIAGALRVGDLLNGNDPFEQVANLASEVVGIVKDNPGLINGIDVIFGNHTEQRVTPYNGVKNPNTSYVFHSILEVATGLPCTYGEELRIEVAGTTYTIMHGHQFKSRKAVEEYHKNAHTGKLIISHWHQYINKGDVIFLPSAKVGEDSYTTSLGYAPNPGVVTLDYKGYFKYEEIYGN